MTEEKVANFARLWIGYVEAYRSADGMPISPPAQLSEIGVRLLGIAASEPELCIRICIEVAETTDNPRVIEFLDSPLGAALSAGDEALLESLLREARARPRVRAALRYVQRFESSDDYWRRFEAIRDRLELPGANADGDRRRPRRR